MLAIYLKKIAARSNFTRLRITERANKYNSLNVEIENMLR